MKEIINATVSDSMAKFDIDNLFDCSKYKRSVARMEIMEYDYVRVRKENVIRKQEILGKVSNS